MINQAKHFWTPTLLFSLLATVLLFAGGCHGSKGTKDKKEEAKPVIVSPVQRQNIEAILSYPADLRPVTTVRIYSTIPDRILMFPWKNGDSIKQGERVALIRRDGLEQGLVQMSAQMEGLDVQIQNLESERKRMQGLLAAGAIAQAAYDRVDTSYKALVAQRKALRAGRGRLAVTAGRANVTAPISGIIAQKLLNVGDMAAPQIPLCSILDVTRLKIELRLIERDAARVKVGMDVELKLDAYPGRVFKGKVASVLPYVDPVTRTNTAEVHLDNSPDPKTGKRPLKSGMFGTARIVVARHENVVVVPENAVLLDNDVLSKQHSGELLRKVFVIDGAGTARQHLVRLGAREKGLYQVLDGLKQGEKLVVRGQHGLKQGQHVTIISAPSSQ